MQPPTGLPLVTNGVHFVPAGHSPSDEHMTISVDAHTAAQWVPLNPEAMFAHCALAPRTRVPVPQQFIPPGQSATGSAHCQSISAVRHAVADATHVLRFAASQQCWEAGVQETAGLPPVPLKGQ
jgi:hypothetical protein